MKEALRASRQNACELVEQGISTDAMTPAIMRRFKTWVWGWEACGVISLFYSLYST